MHVRQLHHALYQTATLGESFRNMRACDRSRHNEAHVCKSTGRSFLLFLCCEVVECLRVAWGLLEVYLRIA